MTGEWIAVVVALWLVVIVLAVTVLGLLRRVEALSDRPLGFSRPGHPLGGLPPGGVVGPFQAVDPRGQEWSALPVTGPAVVLLTAPGCAPCESLLLALGADDVQPLAIPLVVVTSDNEAGRALTAPAWSLVLYQRGTSVFEAFQTIATPQVFLLGSDGRVVETTIPGTTDDLRTLTDHALTHAPSNDEEATATAVPRS